MVYQPVSLSIRLNLLAMSVLLAFYVSFKTLAYVKTLTRLLFDWMVLHRTVGVEILRLFELLLLTA